MSEAGLRNNKNSRQHEQLPFAFHFVPNESGAPKIEALKDFDEAEKVLRELVFNHRFKSISNRLHGGYRQTATGYYEVYCGDPDRIKAGRDRLDNYNRVLQEKGLEPINWAAIGVETWLFALYKRGEEGLEYKGLSVFAEGTEQGLELLEILKRRPIGQQAEAAPEGGEFRSEPHVTEETNRKRGKTRSRQG